MKPMSAEPTKAMRIAAGDIADGFEGLCADNVLAIHKAMLDVQDLEPKSSHLTLSRTNLLALLAKLDIVKNGGTSSCAIIKYQNRDDPVGQSMDSCIVRAIEDEDYYVSRASGKIHKDTIAQMNSNREVSTTYDLAARTENFVSHGTSDIDRE